MKNTVWTTIERNLPAYIRCICSTLENAGFSAYVVGGCVRDLLLGKTPVDYDIATAAHPEDIKRLFTHTIDTGILHGTVTVVLPEGTAEVTTFRSDGLYRDRRRPDSITFVSVIEEDLARRDFTINAMAYSPLHGLKDPFSGRFDLERSLLRTVGSPRMRFEEDALRILRLHRFSAQLSFSIEKETGVAADSLANTLSAISKERIYTELEKFLCNADVHQLKKASIILREILGDIDLSDQTLIKVASCTFIVGKWVHLCGFFSSEKLCSLHAPRAIVLSAKELCSYKKGKHIITDVAKLRYTSPEDFFAFLNDKTAEEIWKSAGEKKIPRSIAELSISGDEIKKIGFSGKEIGDVLQYLFMHAIENPADNKKEILKEFAIWIYRKKTLQKE